MNSQIPLRLEPVEKCQVIKGMYFAPDIKFRQLLITGPPGSGKSTLNNRLGGWPHEGYIDLSQKGWWKNRTMAVRPREVHMGFPFDGGDASLVVFEKDWLADWEHLKLDVQAIQLPPLKRFPLSVDWRGRFAFEFLLPDPREILEYRIERAKSGSHQVDTELHYEQIKRQVEIFSAVAVYFHNNGITVHVRDRIDHIPCRIVGDD